MAKKLPRKNGKKEVGCPVEVAIEAIGGRWKVMIIHYLLDGPQRFGELTRLLKGISARTLTKQLRELEDFQIVNRKIFQQIPPKVEYSLTPLGMKLKPILFAMQDWSEDYQKAVKNKVSD